MSDVTAIPKPTFDAWLQRMLATPPSPKSEVKVAKPIGWF